MAFGGSPGARTSRSVLADSVADDNSDLRESLAGANDEVRREGVRCVPRGYRQVSRPRQQSRFDVVGGFPTKPPPSLPPPTPTLDRAQIHSLRVQVDNLRATNAALTADGGGTSAQGSAVVAQLSAFKSRLQSTSVLHIDPDAYVCCWLCGTGEQGGRWKDRSRPSFSFSRVLLPCLSLHGHIPFPLPSPSVGNTASIAAATGTGRSRRCSRQWTCPTPSSPRYLPRPAPSSKPSRPVRRTNLVMLR